jgi:hypothetical protein
MSKHVWLTKPTPEKAARLLATFQRALKAGMRPVIARCFAGYYLERERQGGGGSFRGLGGLLHGGMRGGYRFATGKNSAHYSKCFNDHVPLMLDVWLRIAGLAPDTPPGILADWLGERGDGEKEALVRSLVS